MPQSCPSCGARVNPSDAFCPNCGYTLRASSQATTPYQPAPSQRDWQGDRPRVRQRSQPARDTPQSRQARQRNRPWFRKKRFILPLVLLLLFGAGGAAGMWYINNAFSELNQLSTPPPDETGEKPPSQQVLEQVEQGDTADLGLADLTNPGGDSVTVLLMGVDARPGEPIDINVRPDSLQVLHISGDGGTCRTLSIPRDTRTELPGYGQSKINHALAVGGIPYEKLVVEQFLGIGIDHFALIDFAGMGGIIDSMGGVTVTNPEAFSYEGVSVPAGQPTLNGEQALVFARFRDDAEGDFGRQRRQQELLQAMLQQAGGRDIVRMAPTILGNLEGHFKTDLKVTSLVSLVGDARLNCASGDLETASMEGTVGSDWDELEGMELSFVQVPDAEVAAKVGWLLDQTAAALPSGLPYDSRERRDIGTWATASDGFRPGQALRA